MKCFRQSQQDVEHNSAGVKWYRITILFPALSFRTLIYLIHYCKFSAPGSQAGKSLRNNVQPAGYWQINPTESSVFCHTDWLSVHYTVFLIT